MPAFDYYLVIDFEASGHVRDSKEWEIVEFPIVVVDAQRLQVQTCEFHRYVKPTRNPQLSEFCITNCGISQHDVDQASTIDVVVREAIDWVSSLNLGGRFAVATCGDYDLKTALQAEAHRKQFSLPDWLQCWVNIKVPFARLFGGATGMKGMLSRLKLNLDGRHHRGIDDARKCTAVTDHQTRLSASDHTQARRSRENTKVPTVRIDEPWLSWLISGAKTHEGRVFRGMWAKLAKGDQLIAYSEKYAHVDLTVVDLLRFADFDSAFASLGKRLVPEGATTPAEALELYRKWNTAETVRQSGGVVAVEVKVGDVHVKQASR
eukprot:TRINITY_DN7222_c0_g2_i2.p1 TRINITY_DN7222_c0_g2~~TRINITY_DN7222_c0_g2_i2.p1  ORF type:complete len:320 (+),score=45.12 TRINITY_DN7222_c0_g2_i2:74-1033(+)